VYQQKDNLNKIKRYVVILSLGPSSYFDYGHTDCRYCSAIAKRCNEERKKAAGKNIKNAHFILPFDDVVGQCDIIKEFNNIFLYIYLYQDKLANEIDDISKSTNETVMEDAIN
jgi:hypothetical protein